MKLKNKIIYILTAIFMAFFYFIFFSKEEKTIKEPSSFIVQEKTILKIESIVNIGKEEIEAVMEKVGLEKSCFKKKYKTYSLGMKQKLGIAAAIMERPELILLDEPTNALDEESVKKLLGILKEEKERGACVILASHDMEELTLLSDIIFIMEEGRVRKAE